MTLKTLLQEYLATPDRFDTDPDGTFIAHGVSMQDRLDLITRNLDQLSARHDEPTMDLVARVASVRPYARLLYPDPELKIYNIDVSKPPVAGVPVELYIELTWDHSMTPGELPPRGFVDIEYIGTGSSVPKKRVSTVPVLIDLLGRLFDAKLTTEAPMAAFRPALTFPVPGDYHLAVGFGGYNNCSDPYTVTVAAP